MALEVTGRFRYPSPRPEWLARHSEPVLAPDLPIVDAHHHLWNEGGNAYGAAEYLADHGTGHNVVATVFAEARFSYRPSGPEHLRPVGETEAVVALAQHIQHSRPQLKACAAIIAAANLRGGAELEETLDAHQETAEGRLRGVRQSAARDSHFPEGIVLRPAPQGLLADGAYRQGLRVLARRGLSFDALIYHEQLRELEDLAAAIPELPIILNHYGCPIGVGYYRGREQERFTAWRSDLAALAKRPNVHLKLGGLGMIVCGTEYHLAPEPPHSQQLAEDFRPWFETAVEAFGSERCMFESNFPVDKAMYSYPVLWNAFKRLSAGASATERQALFSGTAARLYRIALD